MLKTQSLYQDEILDIYEENLNVGKIKNPTHEAININPLCNDTIHITLNIKNDKVEDAKFTNKGCFVTKVASSILTEHIKGMSKKEILALQKVDLDKMIGINISPTRIKCELLPLEALKEAIK